MTETELVNWLTRLETVQQSIVEEQRRLEAMHESIIEVCGGLNEKMRAAHREIEQSNELILMTEMAEIKPRSTEGH